MPMPHYNTERGWFQGPSFGQQFMGEKADGVAIGNVWYENIAGRVKSPFELTCESDLECQTLTVRNQCQSYCGNSDPENKETVKKLERNRVCDPGSFAPKDLNCRCVLGSCTDLK